MVGSEIEGVTLCRNGPKISHLFFADDSLIFCRAQVKDVRKIQEVLGKDERASDQKINSNKTTLFFQSECPRINQGICKEFVGGPGNQRV